MTEQEEELVKPKVYRPAYVRKVLQSFGIDVFGDENFKGTADRWLKYMEHYLQPYDPVEILSKSFKAPTKGNTYGHAMIVQGPIPYQAMCAHHLLPVLGTAHVGYIAQDRVVGLSKLTRLVYGIAHRRPSLQEDVGNEIVEALMTHLNALGAMCVISAEHGCMAARGVESSGVLTTTSSLRGVFIDKHETRNEFMQLVGLARP